MYGIPWITDAHTDPFSNRCRGIGIANDFMALLPENSDTDHLTIQFSANSEVFPGPRLLIIGYGYIVVIAATLQSLWFDELLQLIGGTPVAALFAV